MVFLFLSVLIGCGATLVMDLWALLMRKMFNIPSLDYALVGRWIGHMPKGRFAHASIGLAAPVAGEKALGWAAHYAIGVVFAGVLLAVWGTGWAASPTLVPALAVGIGSVVMPFFIMQPAFGFGVAASRAPAPWTARARSLMAHTSFAVGLYAAGLGVSAGGVA
ncbi:DUF2938 domain-containing protein [Pyruvatibacter mobilis]|uniref:DUF2938 domain-containing protein n=1 Tax=Pyruvatibacter mobilis TaxID=1712261 RepID=UPI003D0EB63A